MDKWPSDWISPIKVKEFEIQTDMDPMSLLPSRNDLSRARLEFQRGLILSGRERMSAISVSMQGVICDGHHAIRAAVEEGRKVDVVVTPLELKPSAASILELPVR